MYFFLQRQVGLPGGQSSGRESKANPALHTGEEDASECPQFLQGSISECPQFQLGKNSQPPALLLRQTVACSAQWLNQMAPRVVGDRSGC